MENLKFKNIEENSWLAGFADGEGCFSISFNLREKMNHGLEIKPSFSISQKRDRENVNRDLLFWIKNFFEGGSVRLSRSDQTWKYETRNIKHLVDKIIPYFENNELKTSKKNDFARFKRVCFLIKSKHHLSNVGVKEIIETSSLMNSSGVRKFSKEFLLRLLDKVKI